MDSPELDVTFLCTGAGLSRASPHNRLKAMTSVGTNDYINEFRMEKATQLISTINLTFTEVTEKIGFTTSRYLSTSFKQYTGETPTQYKEKIREKQQGVAIRRIGYNHPGYIATPYTSGSYILSDPAYFLSEYNFTE